MRWEDTLILKVECLNLVAPSSEPLPFQQWPALACIVEGARSYFQNDVILYASTESPSVAGWGSLIDLWIVFSCLLTFLLTTSIKCLFNGSVIEIFGCCFDRLTSLCAERNSQLPYFLSIYHFTFCGWLLHLDCFLHLPWLMELLTLPSSTTAGAPFSPWPAVTALVGGTDPQHLWGLPRSTVGLCTLL